MNDVLLGDEADGHKAPHSKQNESIRVHCEATDCGAMLEIQVPSGQYSSSVIVRCGNCQRLLSVWLNKGGRPMVPHTPPFNESALYTSRFGDNVHSATLCLGNGQRAASHGQSPITTVHLARPPPLSRTHGMSYYEREAMGDAMVKVPLTSSCDTAATTVGIDSASVTNNSGFKPNMECRKRSLGGKTRKERPFRQTSPYNRFMSQEVKRIKAENPELDHRKAFKMAASNWARSPTACQRSFVKMKQKDGGTKMGQKESPSMRGTASSNTLALQNAEPTGWMSRTIESQEKETASPLNASKHQGTKCVIQD